MRANFRSLKRWTVAGVIALTAFAPPALAQKKGDDNPQPPFDVTPLQRDGMAWVPWVFVFLFTAGVLLVSFKNPHRGHQD